MVDPATLAEGLNNWREIREQASRRHQEAEAATRKAFSAAWRAPLSTKDQLQKAHRVAQRTELAAFFVAAECASSELAKAWELIEAYEALLRNWHGCTCKHCVDGEHNRCPALKQLGQLKVG